MTKKPNDSIAKIAISQAICGLVVLVCLVCLFGFLIQYLNDTSREERKLDTILSGRGFDIINTTFEALSADRCPIYDVYMDDCVPLDSLFVHFDGSYTFEQGIEPYGFIAHFDGFDVVSISLLFNGGDVNYRFYEVFNNRGDRFIFKQTNCEVNAKTTSTSCTDYEVAIAKLLVEYKDGILNDIKASDNALIDYFTWLRTEYYKW